jgi:hypothetical protein
LVCASLASIAKKAFLSFIWREHCINMSRICLRICAILSIVQGIQFRPAAAAALFRHVLQTPAETHLPGMRLSKRTVKSASAPYPGLDWMHWATIGFAGEHLPGRRPTSISAFGPYGRGPAGDTLPGESNLQSFFHRLAANPGQPRSDQWSIPYDPPGKRPEYPSLIVDQLFRVSALVLRSIARSFATCLYPLIRRIALTK